MTTTKRKTKQLGQILIEQGLIDDEQLERALEEHRKTPKSLGRVLIDLGLIKESDLVKALAEQVEALASEAAELADQDDVEVGSALEEAPIVRLVTAIMTQAVGDRASDVHIEPTEKDVRIRFRVDGVLHEVMHSPKNIQGGLISRLKVMADLNIAEKRVPQDGRMSMRVGGRQLDLRVATLPTVYGEKVVIRVLDKTQALMRLEDLGFLEDSYRRFEVSFKKPYGALLVTGPTGSGKSTTMYATLNILNK